MKIGMLKISMAGLIASFGVLLRVAAPAGAADTYPSRPITLIIPFAPGGSSDISGRLIAAKLSEKLGQPVIVENKGGSGTIGGAAIANAKPDGYTLGHISSGAYSIRPHFPGLPYDVFKDYRPVAYMMTTFTGLIASKDFAPNTLQELIAYAKANPGKVTFASSGTGGYSHILGEALNITAGIQMVHVPYSGSAAAMTDLLGNRVNILFDSSPVERIESKQAKGLAAMSPTRIKQLPNLPSVNEVIPNFPIGDSGWGIVAPAKTPDAIVKKLSDTLMEISKDPDYIKKVDSYGFGLSPVPAEEFGKQMRTEYNEFGTVIAKANIKLEN